MESAFCWNLRIWRCALRSIGHRDGGRESACCRDLVCCVHREMMPNGRCPPRFAPERQIMRFVEASCRGFDDDIWLSLVLAPSLSPALTLWHCH